MSDEQKFGREAELESAGYTPLRYHGAGSDESPITERKAESETFGSDASGLEKAATELDNQRRREQQEAPIRKTEWTGDDPDKPTAFADAETAAEALKLSRNKYAEENIEPEQAKRDQQLRDAIDRERGEPTKSEREQAVIAEDRRQAEHQENLQRAYDQIQADNARQKTAQIGQVEQTIHGQRMAVLSGIANLGPELSGLSDLNQLGTALATIESRDPQRGRALRTQIGTLVQLNRQHAAVQQAKQQHGNAEFKRWAKGQDDAFQAKHGRDANYRDVASNIGPMLREHGIDPVRVAQLMESPEGAFLRSAEAQSLLYSMAKARGKPTPENIRERLAAKKAPAPVPAVIRPGTSAPRQPAGAALLSQLNAKLKNATGDRAARIAADILANKRRASR